MKALVKHFHSRKRKSHYRISIINLSKRGLSSHNPISPLSTNMDNSSDSIFSEYGLIKYRTIVEVEWLKSLVLYLIDDKYVNCNRNSVLNKLDNIISSFNLNSAYQVKQIEHTTNHDVKAVEYYIKKEMDKLQIPNKIKEFTHFCCTSEDINNLAWSLVLKEYLHSTYSIKLNLTLYKLRSISEKYASLPMISLTHGQIATPTTFGKEIANFTFRINELAYKLRQLKLKAKMNGAVGNFNAHYIVVEDFNWVSFSKDYIENLGLDYNPFTTQIENHDAICQVFSYCSLINSVFIDMIRDLWGYSSLNYIKFSDETGNDGLYYGQLIQSVENDLLISNSILNHLRGKLPISRFQRDLSDSTVIRNIGIALQYSVNSFCRITSLFNSLHVNKDQILNDLDDSWELLAEPLQTVMRYYGLDSPYEKLKELTRGKKFSKEEYLALINSDLPKSIKDKLLNLTPMDYIGKANDFAADLKDYLK